MKDTMSDFGSTALGAAIWKFGVVKLVGFGAALIGAGIMAAVRPPQTKKEMFLQAAVALGGSFLLGGSVLKAMDYYLPFIDLAHSTVEDKLSSVATAYGLIGAVSWGLFGALATLRERFSKDPVGTVKEIKNDVL